VNFAEWARHILNAISAELASNPDDRLAALLDELAQYVPAARPRPGHLGFAVPLELRTPRGDLRLMTTIMSFATAVDVTIAELRLEAFLPADAHTASVLLAQNNPAS
jgi:MmyB-like transcription regulator ligand binding domain